MVALLQRPSNAGTVSALPKSLIASRCQVVHLTSPTVALMVLVPRIQTHVVVTHPMEAAERTAQLERPDALMAIVLLILRTASHSWAAQ